jgi:hypothetical protein
MMGVVSFSQQERDLDVIFDITPRKESELDVKSVKVLRFGCSLPLYLSHPLRNPRVMIFLNESITNL